MRNAAVLTVVDPSPEEIVRLRATEGPTMQPGAQISHALEVLPGSTRVIIDLCGAARFVGDGASQLRQAVARAARSGTRVAIAADTPDILLGLIRQRVDHLADVTVSVESAAAKLRGDRRPKTPR